MEENHTVHGQAAQGRDGRSERQKCTATCNSPTRSVNLRVFEDQVSCRCLKLRFGQKEGLEICLDVAMGGVQALGGPLPPPGASSCAGRVACVRRSSSGGPAYLTARALQRVRAILPR